jgi:hypothetical protein
MDSSHNAGFSCLNTKAMPKLTFYTVKNDGRQIYTHYIVYKADQFSQQDADRIIKTQLHKFGLMPRSPCLELTDGRVFYLNTS